MPDGFTLAHQADLFKSGPASRPAPRRRRSVDIACLYVGGSTCAAAVRVELKGFKPAMAREVLVDPHITRRRLHAVMQGGCAQKANICIPRNSNPGHPWVPCQRAGGRMPRGATASCAPTACRTPPLSIQTPRCRASEPRRLTSQRLLSCPKAKAMLAMPQTTKLSKPTIGI